MFGIVPNPGIVPAAQNIGYPNVYPGVPGLAAFYSAFIYELVLKQPGTIPAQPTVSPATLINDLQTMARFPPSKVGRASPVWFSDFMGRQAARWFALQWFNAFGYVDPGTAANRFKRANIIPVANETNFISATGQFASTAAQDTKVSTQQQIVDKLSELVQNAVRDSSDSTQKRTEIGKKLYGSAAGYMYRLFLLEYLGNVPITDEIIQGGGTASPAAGSAQPGSGSNTGESDCGCDGGSTKPDSSMSTATKVILAGAVAAGGWYFYRKSKGLPFF
jgi:hypothetical protein